MMSPAPLITRYIRNRSRKFGFCSVYTAGKSDSKNIFPQSVRFFSAEEKYLLPEGKKDSQQAVHNNGKARTQ